MTPTPAVSRRPGVGVKEQILSLKQWLIGKDPLEIDRLYVTMGEGTAQLSGTRCTGRLSPSDIVGQIDSAIAIAVSLGEDFRTERLSPQGIVIFGHRAAAVEIAWRNV